jgi:hypothetical protein
VRVGDQVRLDGSGSSDPDGGSVAGYAWQVTGPLGNTASFEGVRPTFTATRAGDYRVRLVVTDDEGAASAPATGTITATAAGGSNRPPTVAIEGKDERKATVNVPALLVATGRDPDGDPLSYRWTATPAAGATFLAPRQARTTVTFASSDDDDYTLTVRSPTVGAGRGRTR